MLGGLTKISSRLWEGKRGRLALKCVLQSQGVAEGQALMSCPVVRKRAVLIILYPPRLGVWVSKINQS